MSTFYSMGRSPVLLLLHVPVLLLLIIVSQSTTTRAFTIHNPSIITTTSTTRTTTSSSSNTILYGSIYAPGKDDDKEKEGFERDHLGRLRPKQQQVTGKTSIEKPTASTATTATTATTGTSESTTNDKHAGKIPIRFINFETIGGVERVAYAEPDANILKVADEAGVKIPRQCRSGLCGSCTTDVKDPTWTTGDRLGYQTVRACQAGAMVPAGCDEMILDCFRIGTDVSGVVGGVTVEGGGGGMGSLDKKPLSNFEDGWEDEFSPDYKTKSTSSSSSSTTTTVAAAASTTTTRNENGTIEVVKKTTPEFTVKHGEKSTIEIEKPHWTPRIDANIPPWETVW